MGKGTVFVPAAHGPRPNNDPRLRRGRIGGRTGKQEAESRKPVVRTSAFEVRGFDIYSDSLPQPATAKQVNELPLQTLRSHQFWRKLPIPLTNHFRTRQYKGHQVNRS